MKTRSAFSLVIVLLLIMVCCSNDGELPIQEPVIHTPVTITPVQDTFVMPKSETFTFSSNGIDIKGKIYLPDSYETNKDLPAIYLLDYKEQHFNVATDETEQVVKGIQKIIGLDALVITLDAHLDIDAQPATFGEHYEVFKNMSKYVDANYTDNTSRTFIARGSEAGIVLLALLSEDQASPLFKNFISTDSPSSFNDAVIKLIENSNIPEDLEDKKLHFSFSNSNNRSNCLELINSFEEAQYPWLKFESVEYTSNYETTYPTSFAEGLKFVFEE